MMKELFCSEYQYAAVLGRILNIKVGAAIKRIRSEQAHGCTLLPVRPNVGFSRYRIQV